MPALWSGNLDSAKKCDGGFSVTRAATESIACLASIYRSLRTIKKSSLGDSFLDCSEPPLWLLVTMATAR